MMVPVKTSMALPEAVWWRSAGWRDVAAGQWWWVLVADSPHHQYHRGNPHYRKKTQQQPKTSISSKSNLLLASSNFLINNNNKITELNVQMVHNVGEVFLFLTTKTLEGKLSGVVTKNVKKVTEQFSRLWVSMETQS